MKCFVELAVIHLGTPSNNNYVILHWTMVDCTQFNVSCLVRRQLQRSSWECTELGYTLIFVSLIIVLVVCTP